MLPRKFIRRRERLRPASFYSACGGASFYLFKFLMLRSLIPESAAFSTGMALSAYFSFSLLLSLVSVRIFPSDGVWGGSVFSIHFFPVFEPFALTVEERACGRRMHSN
ncbi:hypothetical protein TRVL_00335 [Trypanosoma vivax]|nr:hypothetical protein TRVL_00335 [Trypanosoma vivax]